MTEVPDIHYARTADGIHVAYQVVGEGPPDLVFVPSAISHLEGFWEEPLVARYFRRLASFSRLIMFDKRGTGMSDRAGEVPTLEERMEDVRAVMDAAGSERAAICGMSEGGAIGAMFAATYPERVTALVLLGAAVKCWLPADAAPLIDDYVAQHWGTGGSLDVGAPSVAKDERLRAWIGRVERLAASPGAAAALMKMNTEFDARSILSAVSAPTLVIHRTGDRTVGVEQGREAAELIAGARYIELPGTDHLPFFDDPDSTLDVIEEFVTGERRRSDADRVLATVLFTDIVASTHRAADVGDRRWRGVLDRHRATAEYEVGRYRGTFIKATGDGILATFDGPGRAIRCAGAIGKAVRSLGIEVRAGLHTGEVEVMGEDIGGIAVHIAARVMSEAGPDEVFVSSSVPPLVAGSGIEFEDRGERQLKGVPGTWRLFSVTG